MTGWNTYEHFANAHGYGNSGPTDADEDAEVIGGEISDAWHNLLKAFERCHKAGIQFDKGMVDDLLSATADDLAASYKEKFEADVNCEFLSESAKDEAYDEGMSYVPDNNISKWIEEAFK